jgi:hypothetical protein
MREIKFRAFDKEKKVMQYSNIVWAIVGLNYPALTGLNDNGNIDNLSDLMQYTGLKDKNGKEIYEGDILKIGNSNIEVIWDKNNALFTLKSNHFHLGFQSTFYEVIGNIYEHPHLLESEK